MKSLSLTNTLLLLLIALLVILNFIPRTRQSRYSMYVVPDKSSTFDGYLIKLDQETGRIWRIDYGASSGGQRIELELGGYILQVPVDTTIEKARNIYKR